MNVLTSLPVIAAGKLLSMPVDPQQFGASARFIVWLDRAVLCNGRAADDAAAFLRAAAGRYMLISTNSRDTGKTMQVKLGRVSLDVPDTQIVLAGEEAIRTIADRHPGARCMIAASRVLMHAARKFGLIVVQVDPDIVLVGRDPTWTYQRLALIANAVAGGAMLIGANAEAFVIGEKGRLVPDTGSLLAAITAMTGQPPCEIVGASLVEIALHRLGCGRDDALLITGCEDGGFAGLIARLQAAAP